MEKGQLLLSLRVAHQELSTGQIKKSKQRIGILVRMLEKELEEEKEVASE